MLKTAKETAQTALEAVRRAQELDRGQMERIEAKQREREAQELAHGEFERLAHSAAMVGELHVVAPGHGLDVGRLLLQGFIAHKLQRRIPFEVHLESLLHEKDLALSGLADRLMVKCRDISISGERVFLHRNSLRSTLETLWRRGDFESPADIDLLIELLGTQTAVDHDWLEKNRTQVESVLRAFESLKAVDAKLHRVRWENLILGPELRLGTYVTWESSDDGGGMATAFCPQRLKWLALNWRELSSWVQELINMNSAAGRFETVFKFFEDMDDGWLIESEESAATPRIGHPATLMSELQSAGYVAVLLKTDCESADAQASPITWDAIELPLIEDLASYELRVSWMP